MSKITRKESIAVGFGVGFLCPLLLFVLCWWIAAVLGMYDALRIPEIGVVVAGFSGLALGVTLDGFYLR